MNRIAVRARRLVGLPMLVALITSLLGAPAGAAQAQAAEPPFLPVTLARLGPMMSGGDWMTPLPLIGEWTGYATRATRLRPLRARRGGDHPAQRGQRMTCT